MEQNNNSKITELDVYMELQLIASEKGIYPDELNFEYDEEEGEYVLWHDNNVVATKKMEKIND